MQYCQEKHEEAYKTMQRLSHCTNDPNALFDAARTAAKTGRKAEALELLSKAIEFDPSILIQMFSEEDFRHDI